MQTAFTLRELHNRINVNMDTSLLQTNRNHGTAES